MIQAKPQVQLLNPHFDTTASPDVSIVIPCFNLGLFLDDAIDSALNQSYPSIEIVVIDDGSTCVQTKEKIERIRDCRILTARTKNLGRTSARNTGISLSRGEYIVPLDADDKIDRTFVSDCISKIDAETGVVYSRARFFGTRSGIDRLPDFDPSRFIIQNCVVVTGLFRRKHWLEFGGYCDEMTDGYEDYEFWMHFAERGLQFARIEDGKFRYRKRPESMSVHDNADTEKFRRMMKVIYRRHRKLFLENIDDLHTAWLDERCIRLAKKEKLAHKFSLLGYTFWLTGIKN